MLWEILPEQAVGVLVDAALPRTVRVGEVYLDAGQLGEPFGLSHFTPPIVGQGQTPLRVDAVEHGSKSNDCRSSSCMIHFCQCAEERASLNQRTNDGRIARSLDQIALPMARHDATLDFRRVHMAADHVRNGAAPICTPSAQSPTLASLAQAGDQLGTQLTARNGVERGVDGLVADLERRGVRLHSAQYARDLTGRKFKLPATSTQYTRSTPLVKRIKHLLLLTSTQPLSWSQRLHLLNLGMD